MLKFFRKAFDSIWRKGLWETMRFYRYPEKIIRILENAYKDTIAQSKSVIKD